MIRGGDGAVYALKEGATMKQTLKEKIQAKLANSEGFTLLEILVVLTIMGFLIAMVAPRLAGISGDAVDTVCDSNQSRMISMMSSYFEKTNRYPDKLTNLVDETAAGDYQLPAISDDDPENGPETIASEFNDRNHFLIHYLTEGEVRELKQMGIVNVFNLNAYDAYLEDGSAIKSGYDGIAALRELQLELAQRPEEGDADHRKIETIIAGLNNQSFTEH